MWKVITVTLVVSIAIIFCSYMGWTQIMSYIMLIYIEKRQIAVSQSGGNFAYREYYQGAVNTKQAFLGDAIVSASTGDKVALISVPIYL